MHKLPIHAGRLIPYTRLRKHYKIISILMLRESQSCKVFIIIRFVQLSWYAYVFCWHEVHITLLILSKAAIVSLCFRNEICIISFSSLVGLSISYKVSKLRMNIKKIYGIIDFKKYPEMYIIMNKDWNVLKFDIIY